MNIADFFWMAFFLGGAVYLFYRSFWKKKGGCHGCGNSGSCDSGEKFKADHGE